MVTKVETLQTQKPSKSTQAQGKEWCKVSHGASAHTACTIWIEGQGRAWRMGWAEEEGVENNFMQSGSERKGCARSHWLP